VKLRPHHIFCVSFLKADFSERGAGFLHVEQRVRDAVWSDEETLIETVEGVDELCRVCPLCRDDRCEPPQGNEEAVRKWDAILLKGLGISYGERMTSRQWRLLIKEKMPLQFCDTRCPSKSGCTVDTHPFG